MKGKKQEKTLKYAVISDPSLESLTNAPEGSATACLSFEQKVCQW